MKKFSQLVKKPLIYHFGDFSQPTKVNESTLKRIQDKAIAENSEYLIITPKDPHIVFEGRFLVSEDTEQEVLQTFQHRRIKPFGLGVAAPWFNIEDIEAFKKDLVESIREVDAIAFFNLLREEQNLPKITPEPEIEKSDLRENYVAGKTLKVGAIVEAAGEKHEILLRGPTYVLTLSESGAIKKHWIADVTEVDTTLTYVEEQYPQYAFKTFQTYHLTEEIREFVESSGINPYSIRGVGFLGRLDAAINALTINIEEGVAVAAEFLEEAEEYTELFEAFLDKEYSKVIEESYVIYNKKEKKVHKDGFDSKDKAYHHLIDTMRFHPDYTVLHKDEVENYKKVQAKLKEAKDYTIAKDIMSVADHKKLMKTSMKKGQGKQGETYNPTSETHRKQLIHHQLGEDRDFDDYEEQDFDKLISGINDVDDIIDAYDDEELAIIDDEGNEVDKLHEEVLNEVLSRMERIKAKMRMARTQSKRERALKLALRKTSTNKVINKRARRLAVAILKKKIAKRDVDKLSVGEKERIERMIEKRKGVVNRIAMKLVPKIRTIERDRLEHKHFTKKGE